MNLRELLEKIALSEEHAMNIYKKIAEKGEENIKKTAEVFAEEKRRHSEEMRKHLKVNEELEEPIPAEIFMLLEIDGKGQESILQREGITKKELFTYALKLEKNSILLYEELVKHFQFSPSWSQVFTNLKEEERKHMYFILRNLHEFK